MTKEPLQLASIAGAWHIIMKLFQTASKIDDNI